MTTITDSIDWGTQISGTTIEYNLRPANIDVGGANNTVAWNVAEQTQIRAAFDLFESFTNLTFTEISTPASAEIQLYKGDFFSGGSLGQANPPGEAAAGAVYIDSDNDYWNGSNLEQGSQSFRTLVHELGHALGLAHAHDQGGSSSVMPGIPFLGFDVNGNPVWDSGSLGDNGLNYNLYTMMSYNRVAGVNGNNSLDDDIFDRYEIGGPMALDIYVLQQKYGVNTSYHTGNDVYELPSANALGSGLID